MKWSRAIPGKSGSWSRRADIRSPSWWAHPPGPLLEVFSHRVGHEANNGVLIVLLADRDVEIWPTGVCGAVPHKREISCEIGRTGRAALLKAGCVSAAWGACWRNIFWPGPGANEQPNQPVLL
jgi:hypothetical protein